MLVQEPQPSLTASLPASPWPPGCGLPEVPGCALLHRLPVALLPVGSIWQRRRLLGQGDWNSNRLVVKPLAEVERKRIWGGGGWEPGAAGCGRLRRSGHGLCERGQSRRACDVQARAEGNERRSAASGLSGHESDEDRTGTWRVEGVFVEGGVRCMARK